MLKADTLEKIAKLLGIDAAAFKAAAEDKDEKDFSLPEDIHIFTQAQLDSRDKNKKDEGIKVGRDLEIKDIKAEMGLEFEGKDRKALVEKAKEAIAKEIGAPADEKVKERDKTIAQMREALKAKDTELESVTAKYKADAVKTQLLSMTLDKKPDTFSNEEWAALIGMSNELFEENGQFFVKRGGEVVKDSKEFKPIPAKDALSAWIDERKLGKVVETEGAGGRPRGNGTPGGGGKSTFAQAKEYIASQGWDEKGMKAQEYINAQAKDNPDFFKES